MKILIVDDSIAERKYLKSLLAEYNCDEEYCGETALHSIDKQHPDIIIMDYMMPTTNGITALSMLKNNPQTQHIPVIMTIKKDYKSYLSNHMLKIGAADVLIKPFMKEELIECLKKVSPVYFKDYLEKELNASNQHQSPILKI